MSHQCRYCSRTFVKESTLSNHVCERKRRFQQEREAGVQWGLQAYLMFYQTTQSTKKISYEDFVNSNYYTAFVRYGRHCHAIHCVNFRSYTEWLLKNNKKLDQWCTESLYLDWLHDYIKRENTNDALTRSLQNIVDYVVEVPGLKQCFQNYFRYANHNRICYHISTGRISPWVVYNCDSGQEFLQQLNEDQLSTVITFVDPDYWNKRFQDFPEDTTFARQVLKLSGL